MEITVEGKPNQLYAQGAKSYPQWDELKTILVQVDLNNMNQCKISWNYMDKNS